MKTTLSKITLIILAYSFSHFSYATDFIYDKLAQSDQALLDVAKMWKIDRGGLDQSCLKGLDKCQGTIDLWSTSMFLDEEGKKYFRQFVDVPPHIYGPKVFEEFVRRYNNWSSKVKQGNICYLIGAWGLRPFNSNFYGLVTEDIGLPVSKRGNYKYPTRVYQLHTTREYVKLIKNGKSLDLIPSSFITQQVYSKLQKFNAIDNALLRPMLKVCGQYASYYEGEPISFDSPLQEPVINFEVNKSIEIIDPKTLKTLDTIPDEWYGYK